MIIEGYIKCPVLNEEVRVVYSPEGKVSNTECNALFEDLHLLRCSIDRGLCKVLGLTQPPQESPTTTQLKEFRRTMEIADIIAGRGLSGDQY
jgi:hypothetical protein